MLMISVAPVRSRRLFRDIKRFGHLLGCHERERQQALTLGCGVQPARGARQVEGIGRAISGA
jgi:hypothetical protein